MSYSSRINGTDSGSDSDVVCFLECTAVGNNRLVVLNKPVFDYDDYRLQCKIITVLLKHAAIPENVAQPGFKLTSY